MQSQGLRCAFMRGGTSKGLVFEAGDLPQDRAGWDAIFLAAMGSPDPYLRQLDGMGGGVSSVSKVCVVGPPSRTDADVDYTFAQVSVGTDTVDYSGNCGNMTAAIAPFAALRNLVAVAADGPAVVRLHNTNTGKVVHAHMTMEGGRPATRGDFVLDGVAGTGSPVRLDFMNPAGAKTGRLLPSAAVCDSLDLPDGTRIRASLIDAANPFVFVDGRDLGLSGQELPAELDANVALKARLEDIRCAASVAMGLTPDLQAAAALIALPKITALFSMVDAPTLTGRRLGAHTAHILTRTVSVGQFHNAIPLTGALCLASAMRLAGTIAAQVMRAAADDADLQIAHPSGCITVDAQVQRVDGVLSVARASAFRTARLLFDGTVFL